MSTVIELNGSAPLLDNQKSVLRADNTFVLWDNETSKLFELDFESHVGVAMSRPAVQETEKRLEGFIALTGTRYGLSAATAAISLRNREINWN